MASVPPNNQNENLPSATVSFQTTAASGAPDEGTPKVQGTQDLQGFLLSEIDKRESFLQKFGISAGGYIKAVKARTKRITERDEQQEQTILGLIDGTASKETEAQLEALQLKASGLIEEMSNSFIPVIDRDFLESELDSDFLSRRNISDEELGKQLNPVTNQPYTREEWDAGMDKWKQDEAARRGIEVDAGEAAGAAFAQILGMVTGRKDVIISSATIAEEERVRRAEMQKSAVVRRMQAKFAGQNAQLKFITAQMGDSMTLYRDSIQSQRNAITASWENEQASIRLDTQIKNGNIQEAKAQAADIFEQLHKLPSELIPLAIARINAQADYANTLAGEVLIQRITTGDGSASDVSDAMNIERKASSREAAEEIAVANKWIIGQRKTWETADKEDLAFIEATLATKGVFWRQNAAGVWSQRPLTLEDVAGTAQAFNRSTPTTLLRSRTLDLLESHFSRKMDFTAQQTAFQRANALDIANIRSFTAIEVAKIRADAAARKLFEGISLDSLEENALIDSFKEASGTVSDLNLSLDEWVERANSGAYASITNPNTGQNYEFDEVADDNLGVIANAELMRNSAASVMQDLFDEYNIIQQSGWELQASMLETRAGTDAARIKLAKDFRALGPPDLELKTDRAWQTKVNRSKGKGNYFIERFNPVTGEWVADSVVRKVPFNDGNSPAQVDKITGEIKHPG